MNKQNQLKLASFFEELAEAQLACDILKTELSQTKGYSPDKIFQVLTQSNSISILQLTKYLQEKCQATEREVYEIMEKFDGQRKGEIGIEDFRRELEPMSGRKNSNGGGPVTPEIQGVFIALLKEYQERFRVLQVCRRDLQHIPPYEIYDCVATHQKGFLSFDQLRIFMQKCDMPLKTTLLNLLMHGLKRRCYRYITLEVFCQNLFPLEFGEYEGFQQKVKEEEEGQFLRRSRRQDEEADRARKDKVRRQENIRKQQRRLQAQILRQQEHQQRARQEIGRDLEIQARLARRSQLEVEKDIRWGAQAQHLVLSDQARLNELSRIRLLEAEAAARNQQLNYERLHKKAQLNHYDLEMERRQAQRQAELQREMQLQRQILEDLNRTRAARIARIDEQQKRLRRDEMMLKDERQRYLERQTHQLLREHSQRDEITRRRQLAIQNQRQAALRLQIALDRQRYAAAGGIGRLNGLASNIGANAANVATASFGQSSRRPYSYSVSRTPPQSHPSSANKPSQHSSGVTFSPQPAQPTTIKKDRYDPAFSRTAEDSKKKAVSFVDKDLKRSYIV